MTSLPQGRRPRTAWLGAALFAMLLTACGGGGDHPAAGTSATPPTVSETATASLASDPNGGARTTPADAEAPAEPSAPTQIATETTTAPAVTANDADAPSEPPASTV